VRSDLFCPVKSELGVDRAPDEMERDFAQRGLCPPDGAMVRECFLRKGVDAPDLATLKDYLWFQAATSCGKIVEKSTADSLNPFRSGSLPAAAVSQELRQTRTRGTKYTT
jgi:hypothetical protein